MIRSQRGIKEARQQEQLSQTDMLLLRYETTRDWVLENTRIVALGAVVLVAIIVGLVWWSNERAANSDTAATYLTRALNYYFQGDMRHAIDGNSQQHISGEPIYGLRFIVQQYGSTTPGREADLFLGNAYYSLGKYDSASIAFNNASSSYPLIDASIQAGRAAIFEHSGNKTQAGELFESAARRDTTNPLAADYFLSAARDYQGAGKNDQAISLYREIVGDYPNTQFDDAAKRELMKMNVEL